MAPGWHVGLHPFHLVVLKVIGCGLSQLTPNSYLQVSGVIARCVEIGVSPTLDILFSIYELKKFSGKLYLSFCTNRMILITCSKSHFSWHKKWVYAHGPGLEIVKPWNNVSTSRVSKFYRSDLYDEVFLREFHGSEPRYDYHDFADLDFLRQHHLVGDPLLEEIEKRDRIPIMPSTAMVEALRKKTRSGHEVRGSSRLPSKVPEYMQALSGATSAPLASRTMTEMGKGLGL